MTQRFNLIAAIAATTIVFGSAPLHAQDVESRLHISNESSRDFKQLFVSIGETKNWGIERVGDSVIASGGSFQLGQLTCGAYSIRLVEESGTECVFNNVAVCGTEATWSITEKMLASCTQPTKDNQR